MCKFLLLIFAAVILAGCSTPQSRTRANPELFESFPPDVQEMIQAGEIDLGFTEEMVRMALGKPDRKYSELTETGRTTVWAYHDRRLGSRLSFGVGTGISRGSGMYGGGVSVGTGGRLRPEEKMRVSFANGEVVGIQQAEN